MIPQITEVNFPSYATLSNATVSLSEMGDRTITTQVKIDGSVVPDFDGWELSFRGERFVLNLKEPQAAKENTSWKSVIDLTFYSWPVMQLKRYFMFNVVTTATGAIMADKYQAPISLNIVNFCSLLNDILTYYFNGDIYVDLNPNGTYSADPATVELNYTYIWDAMTKLYEIYGVRWRIEYVSSTRKYAIKFGYDAPAIDDHTFQYGYDGGLLRFERQVQDADITNILLGRGGTNNVPYRYFKTTDPQNPEWAADPDYVPELANVYFDRIRDINFRRYVQGWRTNENGQLGAIDVYDSSRAATDWAYKKGHEDTVFDPVEYVKDDISISQYGERWGHLDDNDDIYPTIQGVTLDGGRIDMVVAVSPIVTDDIHSTTENAAVIRTLDGVMTQTSDMEGTATQTEEIHGGMFTVATGKVANLMDNGFFVALQSGSAARRGLTIDTSNSSVNVYRFSDNVEVSRNGISAGDYYYTITVRILNVGQSIIRNVTYGVNGLYLQESTAMADEWKPTFDIYVRNIFQSAQAAGESDEDYALRIWRPILGDRLGNEAKVAFSSGFMSISEDYDFTIASYPMPDRTKTITVGGTTFTSEWKITLNKSDAEFDATGLYIPNARTGGKPIAGDHFYFLGIDMPHMYVTMAEQRLNEHKTAGLEDTANVNPTWVIGLDKIRLQDEYNEEQELLFDKIDAGVAVRISDPRFTLGNVLNLFVSTATFTWSDNTVMLPEVEVVLTEKIKSAAGGFKTMQNDINVLKTSLSQMDDMEGVARQATRPLYLGKTGDEQTSYSPTKFASLVTSEDFQQGDMAGEGWGIYRDNSEDYNGTAQPVNRAGDTDAQMLSVMEVDKLVVRREMRVNSLVVNQISYVGGKQIISAASIECVQVVAGSGYYDCYFNQKQGTVKNLFSVNDIALGQVYEADNTLLRYYRMRVTQVGQDYIRLTTSGKDGAGVPQKGDVIVQYGNTNNADRQYVIVRDVIGGGYEQMISGLNSTTATGTTYYYAGHDTYNNSPTQRWYVGNSNTNIEFNSARGGVFLKGTIVQSPSGDAFPTPCYRGEFSSSNFYFYGDVVTYQGQTWMHVGTSSTYGNNPPVEGNIWHLYAAKGADGSAVYRLDLTNESATINADANGNILPGAARPTCTATLYLGTAAQTENVTYGISPNDVPGLSINATSGVLLFADGAALTPFSFSGTSLEITVTAYVSSQAIATAIMTVTKVMPGADGTPATSYWLVLDTDKVSVNPNDTTPAANPPTVTPSAMMQVGESAPTPAASVCTIKYTYDNETPETDIANNTPHTVLLENASTHVKHKTLHFYMYKGATLVDQESVPILYDGEDGADGASALFANLTNDMDAIGVGADGVLQTSSTITKTTTFQMWLGTAPQSLTSLTADSAAIAALPQGVTVTTAYATGAVTISVADGTALDGTYAIPLTGTCAAGSLTLTYKLMGVKDGADGASFILIPSVTDIKKTYTYASDDTPTANISPSYVTCDAKTSDGEDLTIDYSIRYKADGGVLTLYKSQTDGVVSYGSQSLQTNGIPTAAVTSDITLYLFLETPNAGGTNYVDIETIPLVADGLKGTNGAQGGNGKTMRGMSEWSSTGFGGTGSYQGENDADGTYIDIVIDPDNKLYYKCAYSQNPTSGTYATSAKPSLNLFDGTHPNGCWTLMNNYENIATKALVAEEIAAKYVVVDALNTGLSSSDTAKVHIEGRDINVINGSNSPVVRISSNSLMSDQGGSGTFSQSGSYSGTSANGDLLLTGTVISALSITSGYNRATLGQFTCTLECYQGSSQVEIDDDVSIYAYITNGAETITVGQYADNVHNYASVTFASRTFENLSTGTWSLVVEFSLSEEIHTRKIRGTATYVTMSGSYSSAPAEKTLIGGDGFLTQWGTGGFKSTSANGAQVIQGGTAYSALAGENGLLRLCLVTGDYPGTLVNGVLYIKVSSS